MITIFENFEGLEKNEGDRGRAGALDHEGARSGLERRRVEHRRHVRCAVERLREQRGGAGPQLAQAEELRRRAAERLRGAVGVASAVQGTTAPSANGKRRHLFSSPPTSFILDLRI